MSDFILPDIGEGIVECELVKWLVSEGDMIEEDQPVVEVMTDKALVEIPAPHKGQVKRLYYKEGDIAKVHAPLFELSEEGSEQEESVANNDDGSAPEKANISSAPASQKAETKKQASDSNGSNETTSATEIKTPASPAVRRLMREYDLSLGHISGSGRDGRVLKEDVLAHLKQPEGRTNESVGAQSAKRSGAIDQQVRIEPIKGMKAVMAKRMVASASTIPHFIFNEDIDVTELLALRAQLKPLAEASGSRLTLMPFIMKAMALAIRDYPILNSRVNDEVTEIHYQPQCNIGMAVDSKAGLMVPNIKGVEHLTLLEIADEVTRLTEAAREGRVAQDDLKGGTITISNIGALGGTYASPIINAPEVAIVALGRTQTLPRFDQAGNVTARAIMPVSWAGDHRIIDGGTIARFSNCWKGYLESPQSMLLHLG
ncbi:MULTISPECIES: 2-oxo acid dehydrogenase subunit E2 [unclassified Marinobacter]|uniref:2-oxo acid dehydrogenase subunit E2 n=1 Tax=unclassified Marinobacter TaxID=83889 RepID=UPI000BF85EC5|nr:MULTISPECIES: 2-oxo acid dehydrogenase subunit E2 [unclassified Marinobacter]PFG09688.1 2-oxoisovalerate dehydrogenase E2 component (dihydrolipoyl transacylase) [Marinobacter sp. LV10MA510-1]PFG51617.1 2-oxoisovalerate dehydrogenase E2 component (dihydrolipoyl transacylase) [Marinobacter sp. LV10R520-4]